MRHIVIACLLFVISPFLGPLVEHCMTDAPDYVWRLITWACISCGVLIAILSDPIFNQLKGPSSTAITSIIIMSVASAVILGTTWHLFIYPWFVRDQKVDGISKIEILLKDMREPTYRRLVAAVIYSFDPKSELAVGPLVPT
jgi:hypothetical protein